MRVDRELDNSGDIAEADKQDREEEREFKQRFRRAWNPCARDALIDLRMTALLTDGQIKRLMNLSAITPEQDGVRLQKSMFLSRTGAAYAIFFGALGSILFLSTIFAWHRLSVGQQIGDIALSLVTLGAMWFSLQFLYWPWPLVQKTRDFIAGLPAKSAGLSEVESRNARGADTRNYKTTLRIIHILLDITKLDVSQPHGLGKTLGEKLALKGFEGPDSETIAKHIKKASQLSPDVLQHKK